MNSQRLLNFSTVICAPVFTHGEGLSTQLPIGPAEGFKYSSWIMCDNLVSLRKADLTNFIGSLSSSKVTHLVSGVTENGSGSKGLNVV
jgi:mRNA-degrading endonuclease toxin of MazEF toxin-antitoxin module